MRMSIRRLRGSLRFLKKVENHALSVALHYMYYNFCRIHKTLTGSPPHGCWRDDRLWGVADMVKVLEDWETASMTAPPGKED